MKPSVNIIKCTCLYDSVKASNDMIHNANQCIVLLINPYANNPCWDKTKGQAGFFQGSQTGAYNLAQAFNRLLFVNLKSKKMF